ncbi:aldose 1-epimerase family protein [Pseudoduganella aquatica]|uniref:Aldose 1-epimerase family protein n=1 Tax=Pseudoduganella aquatica TaxID=2660641 RepID=A0A7X4HAL1_9BURK|nr:aldose 1-epimerase family protein [Pseudoduganella aquatica]MYN06740.1 aldose 1-epimerase family protein [Pseudoduganella aquatica]
MDQVSLANGLLHCVVALRGAELRSLADAGGEEYLWQRDPAVWEDSAPILFPVVGRLKDGGYRHAGKRYELPIHGFARHCRFAVRETQADSVLLELQSTPATLACYPFAFTLTVRFTLEKNCLRVVYNVHNTGAENMYFSLGSHPGFRLPQDGGASWRLLFSESPQQVRQLDGPLLGAASRPYSLGPGNSLPLSPGLFDDDALIFTQMHARHVALARADGATRLVLDTGGAPDLGIWSRPGASYICIEPWHGYDDSAAVSGELRDKPGIVELAAGATFSTHYAITVHPST